MDFQKIKKQSHRTLIPCVLALTLFKEFILLTTLKDKFTPRFLSNISRNSNCFLLFSLILCRQWWLSHTQSMPHQKCHLHALENKNHLQSLIPLIHHHKAFKPTQATALCQLRQKCSSPSALCSSPHRTRIQGSGYWKGSGDPFCFPASSNRAGQSPTLNMVTKPTHEASSLPTRASSWLISWKVSTGFLMAREGIKS